LIAIYAVIKFVNPEDLRTAFRTVDPKLIILLILLNIFGIIIRGKTWQVILGEGVSFRTAFFGVTIGYFLNNVLPFRAGELGRSYFVGRATGKGTFFVLSTIVIERAFDVAFAAALVVLTLPFLEGMEKIKPIAILVLIVVVAALFVMFLVAHNKDRVKQLVQRVKKPEKLVVFLLPKVQNLIEGFSLLAKPSQFIKSFLWIGGCWVVWSSSYYFAVSAILPGAPFWWGAFVSGLLALGVAIPSAPSALGVFEASFVAAIAILGGETGTALAYAIILHILQFVVIAVFGIWGLVREGVSFSQMMSKIGSGESNGTLEPVIEEAK
jgi:uncharacterized protein (TIRG00374 family)